MIGLLVMCQISLAAAPESEIMKKTMIVLGVLMCFCGVCCLGSTLLVVLTRHSRVERFDIGGKCEIKWFDNNVWYIVGKVDSAMIVPDSQDFTLGATVKSVSLGRRYAVVTCASALNGSLLADFVVELESARVLERGVANSLRQRLKEKGESEVIFIDMGEVDRGWVGGTHWPSVPWIK